MTIFSMGNSSWQCFERWHRQHRNLFFYVMCFYNYNFGCKSSLSSEASKHFADDKVALKSENYSHSFFTLTNIVGVIGADAALWVDQIRTTELMRLKTTTLFNSYAFGNFAPPDLGFSPELCRAVQTFVLPECQADEQALCQQFDQRDQNRKWREGNIKSSFNYLLLDPRSLLSPSCQVVFYHMIKSQMFQGCS